MSFITTTFENMKQQPPKADHGRNLVVIGTSDKGNNYELEEFVKSYEQAKKLFEKGPLLEAYEELVLAGAKYIHLLKIEDNTLESFKTGLDAISGYPANIVVPVGIYFDTPEGYECAKKLAEFCSNIGDCIGVMGVVPFSDNGKPMKEFERKEKESIIEWKNRISSLVREKVNELVDNYSIDKFGDAGMFLNVVFSTVCCFYGDINRAISGHTIYAGLLSNLPPGISPVNKTLVGVDRLLFDVVNIHTIPVTPDVTPVTPVTPEAPLRSLKDVLADIGFVTFSRFVRSGIAPAAAVTMAKKTGLKNVHNVRVLQDVSWYIKMIGNEMLGEPVHKKAQVLKEKISEYLDDYVSVGILRSYNFYLKTNNSDIEVYLDFDFMNTVQIQDVVIKLAN